MGPLRDHGDPARALFTNTSDKWAEYKSMVIGWAVANDFDDILNGKGKDDPKYKQHNGIIYVALARSQAKQHRHIIRGVPLHSLHRIFSWTSYADGAAV
jgi:hypothetical protein